jgi:PKD repeat protein
VSDGTPANTPPTAAFSYQCNQTVCVFTDASTDADGDPLVWSWDFGDGGASTQQHPTHAFASPGNYTVTLEVSDAQGSDTAAASFRVKNRGSASGSTVDGGGSDAGGSEKGRKKCTDGADNDGDGLVDGADPDC